MITNEQLLQNHINEGRPLFFKLPGYFYRKTLFCVVCGAPYVISTPYNDCNPATRDFCDDCLLDPELLELSAKKDGWDHVSVLLSSELAQSSLSLSQGGG